MRATYLYGAGDVRVIDAADPRIQAPTDAVVHVVRASVCGSDLHPYTSKPDTPQGSSMGHEFIGMERPAAGHHRRSAVRPGGVISRVGVPQYDDVPIG